MLDGRAEIVDHQDLGTTAKMPQGIFHAADEVFRGLPVGGLAVRLAAVAQDDAEDVRLATLAVRPDDRRAGAEIHLAFFACGAFHPPHGQHAAVAQPPHETFDAVVAAREAVLAHQILIDPLGAEFLLELRLNDRLKRLALARSATLDRSGLLPWVAACHQRMPAGLRDRSIFAWRPGGRNGWF